MTAMVKAGNVSASESAYVSKFWATAAMSEKARETILAKSELKSSLPRIIITYKKAVAEMPMLILDNINFQLNFLIFSASIRAKTAFSNPEEGSKLLMFLKSWLNLSLMLTNTTD